MKHSIFFLAALTFLFTMPVLAQDLGETPQHAAIWQHSFALVKEGNEALNSGNLTNAESDFREAIAVFQNSAAYSGLAQTLTAQGRTAEAIQIYRTLLYELPVKNGISSNNPNDVEAYRVRVFNNPTRFSFGSDAFSAWMTYVTLLSQTGQWSEAVNIYEKALPQLGQGSLPKVDIHFDPRVPIPDQLQAAAHLALGIDASNRLEHDKAMTEYKKALQLQPNSGLINFYYGYGLQQLGRKAQANAAFQKTVRIAKGNVKAAAQKALAQPKKPA